MQNHTRRDFIKSAAAAAVGAPAYAQGSRSQELPNILYLHSHDSGRYLSPYGHNVPTPNLMRIAKDGVLFRGMFCGAPTCSSSRAALLTGQSSHASGMNGLAHRGWSLHDYKQHMLHTLRAAKGYYTVLAGLQHIAHDPHTIGFDEVLTDNNQHASHVADHAVAWLEKAPKKPFFMDCGFIETHRDYAKPTDNPDFIQPPAPMPDNADTRYDMAGFHQTARNMDQAIGRILDALEQNGLAENTLVISTTDHGIAFPDMKAHLRDAGIGVSCIMRGPREFSKARVCDAMLSQIDIFPTLCEYLGIARPAWLTGKSFLPVLRGETAQINDAVFAEVTYHAAYEPKRCVRTLRYKYIRRFDGRTTAVIPNCDNGPSKTYWLDQGWRDARLYQEEELYDLVFDPFEHRNLARDPAHAAELAGLRKRLGAWMRDTNDPLLKGPVPLPPGGRTTPVDGTSPSDVG